MGEPLPSLSSATTPTCTSTHQENSSLVDHRVMLVLLAVRSSSTPMVAGEPMVVVHFPVRIPPRWTALQHTFADRWPSLWLRVACASVPLYSFPMRSVLPSPCRFSLRLMAQSRANSPPMTLPTSSRSLSIAGLVLLPFP